MAHTVSALHAFIIFFSSNLTTHRHSSSEPKFGAFETDRATESYATRGTWPNVVMLI